MSLLLVTTAQVALLITAGLGTFAFGCENLAAAVALVAIFWCAIGRSSQVSVDLCCRAALTALFGLLMYFVGTLANFLPIEGYVVGSVIVVGMCFLSCYLFLRAETFGRRVAEVALLHGQATDKEDPATPPIPVADPTFPPRVEDGGVTGDMDFPGYHMPALMGLGSWRFSGARLAWSCSLISLCSFLGMCSGLMDLAGDVALLVNAASVYSVSAAVFVKAFFRDGLMIAVFYYIMFCFVRALRRRQDMNNGEVVMMSVFVSATVGTFQNTIYVMTGSSDAFLVDRFSPTVRALLVVPSHCFPSLVIALGVVQLYTVKRGTREAFGVLTAHFWVGVFMFTGFNWVMNMTGIISELQTYIWCVVMSVIINPCVFAVVYRRWKRQRRYHEVTKGQVVPTNVDGPKVQMTPMSSDASSGDSKKSDEEHSPESSSSNHSEDNTNSDVAVDVGDNAT